MRIQVVKFEWVGRELGAIGLSVLLLNCGGHSPAAPTAVTGVSPSAPPTPPVSGGVRRAAGVVYEITPEGRRPLSGVSINAWIDEGRVGYSYWWANGPVKSDADGRYELGRLSEAGTVWFQTWRDGYAQPCAAPRLTSPGDVALDFALVARANIPAFITRLIAAAPGRVISGQITDSRGEPVSGAAVDFEPAMDFFTATTYADADGHYTLCGLPETETLVLTAGSGRRVSFVTIPPGTTTAANIVLPD